MWPERRGCLGPAGVCSGFPRRLSWVQRVAGGVCTWLLTRRRQVLIRCTLGSLCCPLLGRQHQTRRTPGVPSDCSSGASVWEARARLQGESVRSLGRMALGPRKSTALSRSTQRQKGHRPSLPQAAPGLSLCQALCGHFTAQSSPGVAQPEPTSCSHASREVLPVTLPPCGSWMFCFQRC